MIFAHSTGTAGETAYPTGFLALGFGVFSGLKVTMREEASIPDRPPRMIDVDRSATDVFPLPVEEAALEAMSRDLFENHWREITFRPIIQGAAYEFKAPTPPTHIGRFDGYLTIAFGAPHFHICLGEHKGAPRNPASPALARHRRTSRAELYRRLDRSGAPVFLGAPAVQRRRRAADYGAASQPIFRSRH